MTTPAEFLKYIDDNADRFIQRLADAVSYHSVSGDPDRRKDVIKMGCWLQDKLDCFGVTTKRADLGKQTGGDLDLPPVILGRIGDDPKKKTVLVYGHYDVQPAKQEDGWKSDPFILDVEEDGRLVGRGSTDDKGPDLGWLNVLEAHQALNLELPVNMRFCFEGMEESGSEGFDNFVTSEVAKGKDGWFDGVDCVCISDNYWLNTRTPCLTYGLRGIAYFEVKVTGPKRDLHSGMFGRMVHEPMTDLIKLMSTLVCSDGTILIPGVDALVPPLTKKELEIFEKTDYSVDDLNQATGRPIALSDDKVALLSGRMRMASLSLHGIQGAFDGPGSKTVIPATVIGKFSIRLVEPQTPDIINNLVLAHFNKEIAKLHTKSDICVHMTAGAMPWVTDYENPNYEAACRATKAVYGREPDLTREGGSIGVTLTFADKLCVNVLLLPMGRGDDGAHSTNEKLDRDNFIRGSKLFGTYLYELSQA